MSAFNADEAKKITATYISETQKSSTDWISQQMELVSEQIRYKASKGESVCEYAVDLDMDDNRTAKAKFLFDELKKLNFNVDLTEKTNNSNHKRMTVFLISWA